MMSSLSISGFPRYFLLLAVLPKLLGAQATVALATSPNPSVFGAPVVLTATVMPPIATGRVTFYDGVTILGSKPLSSGSASISTILLPAGSRTLKAYYAGDASNAAATSNVAVQKVNALAAGGFTTGTPPSHTANFLTFLADVNGDGKADIIGGDPPAVLVGDGRGNFQPTYHAPDKVSAVGDFNGDGKTDLVVGAGTVLSILPGNGDGTFQVPINTTIEATGGDVMVVGDFNGDGKADLANTLFGILLGNGDGTFRKMPRFGGGTVIVTGDFNGDGITDLATSDGSSNVIILPGNGDGTFRPAINSAVPSPPARMVTGDFNGDGKPDLATICNGSLIVLLGNGDGTFQSPVSYVPRTASYTPYFIAAGDFNGDGIADLLVDSQDVNLFSHNILLGKGDGTFQAPVSFPGSLDDSVLVADFNGDGRTDLFFSDGYLGSLLFGAPVTILPAGGTPQSTTIGTPFGAPLQVTVLVNGLPAGGVPVTFQAPASGPGANLSGAIAITNASGVASVIATANTLAGSYTVTASYQTGTVSFFLTNLAGKPAGIAASGGSRQSTPVGTAFGSPLQATVTDSGGNPVPGAVVTFAMPGAGPSAAAAVLSSTTVVTDPSGIARVTARANNIPGSYVVTASVGAFSVGFSLTNLSGTRITSNVTLATLTNPSTFGAPAVLMAIVSPSNATGRVTFYDGVTPLGSKTLSAGTASFSTILLPAGARTLKALYTGDSFYAPSTSNVVIEQVNTVAGGGFAIQSPLSTQFVAPTSVAVGDFNGDGKADFVYAGGTGSGMPVAVVLGRGDGSFQTPVSYTVAANPRYVAVGDFDGDGIPDLAVSGSALNILLGNGDGTFRPGASYPAPPAFPISVADLNGDGKADLVVSDTIWIGNGDGTFHFQSLADPISSGVLNSLVVDINGDNQADLILLVLQCSGPSCSENLFSYLGNGDGTFQPPVALPAVSIFGFVAGDFNGDGKTDLAFWDASSFLTVLLGAGDGTFGHPQNTIAQVLGRVTTGDFNGDGITDLAVGNADNTVFILRGNGDGTFQQLAGVVAPGSNDALAVADFNGDGRADLVIANAAFGRMNVLLGTAPGAGFQLTATGGTPQSARTGAAFAVPLSVILLNNGIPVPGATVTFSAPSISGHGTAVFLNGPVFLNASAVTNASGVASVTAIASELPGSYIVTATSQGLIASFSLTNTGTASLGLVTPLGPPQSTTVGTAFPSPLQVSVKDNAGNPASGITVRFTAPASGASAVLSSATAVTNASGVAGVTAMANSLVGGYMVTASVGTGTGTLSAQFSLVNLAGGGVSNLAQGRPATQSSTLPGYATAGAGGAVDGSTDGSFFNGSMTATNLDPNPWWQVDLGSSAVVSSIVIWNRTDCCSARLNDYWVFVSDTPFGPSDTPTTLSGRPATFSSHQTSAPNPYSSIAAGGAQGRYVRVQLTNANYLSLAEVQVVGTLGAPPATNLASGKIATQSSTLPGYAGAGAASAVDGNTDGIFSDSSVTATNLDPNPWWQVDLGASATVNSVVVWNRTDCCGSRLNDFWVFISDTPFLPTDTPTTLQNRPGTFSSHQTSAPNPVTTIAGGAQGRYVRVQLTNANYLSLAEVQVLGSGAPAISNLAQGRAATQSSTVPGYPADGAAAAVDGNTDGNFNDTSVTATNADLNAWWQVDLGASASLNSIVVWNRTDCCSARLNDYWVFVSDTPFSPTDTPLTLQNRIGTWSSHQTTAPNPSANIAAVAQGRYVRVQLTGTDYLSLAEVQVFGQ